MNYQGTLNLLPNVKRQIIGERYPQHAAAFMTHFANLSRRNGQSGF